jgi:predicted alpha/beta superfamily hydrolase
MILNNKKRRVTICCYLLILVFLFCYKTFCQDSINTINIGYIIKLKSKVLDEDRTIFIYLPNSYKEAQKSYPVLYLLDAETNFKCTCGIVDLLSRSSIIPEMIIVGLPNKDRMRDLTPTYDKKFKIGGGAENFLKFLKQELIPFIDQNYKTQSFRILNGHSIGGLFTMYTFTSDTLLFNSYIITSPSMYWDDKIMLPKIENFLKSSPLLQKKLYITLANEPEFMNVKETIEIFNKNAPKGLNWKFKQDTTETHEISPLKSTYDGLRFIYLK